MEPGSKIRDGTITLLSRLGEGGFGEVFLGQTPEGLRAVKVIDTSVWTGEEYQVFNTMLMNEASFLSTLDHPGLPKSRGFFAEEKRYFLLMDWVQGHTLEQEVERSGPLELNDLFGLIGCLVDILTYLHRQCEGVVVFGDLKPANILRVESGLYRLVDLGTVSQQGTKMSRKIAVFSPNYSAPEQARGAPSNSSHDLYSLGATIFYAMTGREPRAFRSPPSHQNLVRKVLDDSRHEWGEASVHCFEKLLTLSLAALDQDPGRRPRNVLAFDQAWQRTREIREEELTGSNRADPDEIFRLLYEKKRE